MKVLIDCTPQTVGGGVQVALALLDGLARQSEIAWSATMTDAFFRLTPPHVAARRDCIHLVEKNGLIGKARAALALRRIERRVAPDVVFTVFGPSYFIARAPHLVGFALPHMIYPPDPAIGGRRDGGTAALFATIFRRATHLVVETETVRRRLAARIGVPTQRISVIGNSVNPQLQVVAAGDAPQAGLLRVLTPSAYYPHKNLEIIPDVAAAVKRLAPDLDLRFELTLPPELPAWAAIRARAAALGVADALVTLGALSLTQLADAYRRATLVFLPTVREASTAVYPESFHFRRPLVTSDLDFARELCGEAALYAPPHDPQAWARAIVGIAKSPATRQSLVEAGTRRLAAVYPSPEEKFRQQIALLRRVATGAGAT